MAVGSMEGEICFLTSARARRIEGEDVVRHAFFFYFAKLEELLV
jgi:hypothetical protein